MDSRETRKERAKDRPSELGHSHMEDGTRPIVFREVTLGTLVGWPTRGQFTLDCVIWVVVGGRRNDGRH